VQPGHYDVEFVPPGGLGFTEQNAADDASDSDVDRSSARADVNAEADDLTLDAGLQTLPGEALAANPAQPVPLPEVGPVRSGRLIYSYIADYFEKSCLIYAFASSEVLERLPQCHMVYHLLSGGGYMMSLDEMLTVARQNFRAKGEDFDYTGNLYSQDMPPEGAPALSLKVYFAYQNQSGWAYDALAGAYLRYVDTSEYEQAGILHPDTDRLTSRQLQVENLILVFAKHEVISPTNIDIHLDPGRQGKAVLFRGGRMFKIKWSTDQEGARSPHAVCGQTRAGSAGTRATWVIGPPHEAGEAHRAMAPHLQAVEGQIGASWPNAHAPQSASGLFPVATIMAAQLEPRRANGHKQ
jgi:hypothetical protein